MSKTWRKLLSVLLALSMIVSLTMTGYAVGNGKSAASPTKASSGTKMELEEIDPSTLNVPRLGQITEDEEPDGENLPYKSSDIVRVSIVLDKAPTLEKYSVQSATRSASARIYRAGLKTQQQVLTRKIESTLGRSIDVKWNLTLAMNAISANVRYGDIAAIRNMEGVKSVMLENKYEPQVDEINTANTTEYMVGATALWQNGYTGAGSRVAIIDTGTDQDHLSFDPEAFEYALAEDGGEYNLLTWDEISSKASQLNAPVTEEVYKNTKIPYAYNYVDGGYITDHMSDTEGEHGSHVAGIAAANRYVKINGEFVDAAEQVFAVGVAPNAQILTMKVFGANGGAYDSDYMVAIEDAIVLGCDSVNLSLGSGSPGYTLSNGYQDVMDSLVKCGTVVSISSGNSGAWNDVPYDANMYPYLYMEDVGYHTGGSPGSFANALTIASADNVGIVGSPMVFNGTQTGYPTETSGYGNDPIATLAGDTEYEYVLIDGPGVDVDPANPDVDANENVGKEGDQFWALGSNVLSGKVAMCYRGTSSFFAKANAAAAQGAIAVIIINNTDGVINMNLTGYEYNAPAVSILQEVGDAVKAESEAVTDDEGNVLYYTGKMTIGEMTAAATIDRSETAMSSFSSWGVPGSLILKPELTTPGGNIYSVWGANKGGSSPTDSHEDYEMMSGTSMAAPHAAGMAALVAQYIRENDLVNVTGLDQRTLINSLLMSTATPMYDSDGEYYPVMQQGAGLGDAFAATQAMSYILMGEDATASYADGKVKVELGQDAKREGVYEFSYSINNFHDVDMTYELDTVIGTQYIAGNGGYGLLQDTGTVELNELLEEGFDQKLEGYTVDYDYPVNTPNDHDVNMDGQTDKADAQAILDKITGEYAEDADFDEKAADLDGDGKYTTYDAQLLLQWLEQEFTDLVVPAHDSVTVKVTITLTDYAKMLLDYYYTGGAYIEGFTYVTPVTETEDGELLGVEHTIPILGFYGSWTDASMFDAVSPIEKAYGSPKLGYTGNGTNTNYLTVNYGKGNEIFMGNPYMVEDEFPAERLALNTNTGLVNFRYNLIRNAASTGVLALDENYNVLKGTMGGAALGAWYYVNGTAWQDLATRTAAIGGTAADMGVKEGDVFTLGFFAVPEYYGMMLHPGENINTVTAAEVGQLLSDGELGAGSYVGFTFTVDDTAPEIKEASIRDGEDGGKILSVTVRDNQYVAFVTLLDALGDPITDENGQNKIKGIVPEQTEPGQTVTVEFEITEDLGDGVTILACDYATNESAKLGTINEPMILGQKTIYVLTDTLEDGKNYVFAASNVAGDTKAMMLPETVSRYGGDMVAGDVTVVAEDDRTYIELADGQESMIWTAEASGNYFNLNNVGVESVYPYVNSPRDGQVLMYYPYNYGEEFNLDPTAHTLYYNNAGTKVPFAYDPATDQVVAHRTNADRAPFYAYVETLVDDVFDPTQAYSVTVNPGDVMMVLGGAPAQLTAIVKPLVLENKAVTWSSDNEDVATVDENGVVTAVAVGTATITATSVNTPTVSDSAEVTVIEVDRDLNGIVWDENGQVWPSAFNLTTLPEYEKLIDTPMKTRLTSLTYDEEGIMWACDLDTDEGLSSLYTVDPKTWEPTLVGESEIGYMDLCMAPSLGDYLLGVYGTNVVIIDKATGNYEGAFDLSDYIQGDLVGIAYEEQYEHSAYGNTDWVWLVDSAGYLYIFL